MGLRLQALSLLMAITVVGTPTFDLANDDVCVIPYPTGIAVGDVCVWWIQKQDETPGITLDAEMTEVCAALATTVGWDKWSMCAYRIITGTEGADVTLSLPGYDENWGGGCIALRGVDITTGPWDVAPTHADEHEFFENTGNPTLADLTTVTDGAMVLQMSTVGDSDSTSVSSDKGSATEWMNNIETEGHIALNSYPDWRVLILTFFADNRDSVFTQFEFFYTMAISTS